MRQAIKDFNQDEHGDWIVELACGHVQHVRHNPPWQERPWVLKKESRQKMIGFKIECNACGDELQADKGQRK